MLLQRECWWMLLGIAATRASWCWLGLLCRLNLLCRLRSSCAARPWGGSQASRLR